MSQPIKKSLRTPINLSAHRATPSGRQCPPTAGSSTLAMPPRADQSSIPRYQKKSTTVAISPLGTARTVKAPTHQRHSRAVASGSTSTTTTTIGTSKAASSLTSKSKIPVRVRPGQTTTSKESKGTVGEGKSKIPRAAAVRSNDDPKHKPKAKLAKKPTDTRVIIPSKDGLSSPIKMIDPNMKPGQRFPKDYLLDLHTEDVEMTYFDELDYDYDLLTDAFDDEAETIYGNNTLTRPPRGPCPVLAKLYPPPPPPPPPPPTVYDDEIIYNPLEDYELDGVDLDNYPLITLTGCDENDYDHVEPNAWEQDMKMGDQLWVHPKNALYWDRDEYYEVLEIYWETRAQDMRENCVIWEPKLPSLADEFGMANWEMEYPEYEEIM